jgi:beta-galactosidase
MSTQVALTGRQILVDGEPRFLRSAEIHYFRLKRRDWADRIAAARDCGMNCVASYIPWQWHEPEEGAFDFGADRVPERDLPAFIDLVRDAGLWLFARIGPFVNAELAEGGHPLWLFGSHPEIRSRDATGAFARRQLDGGFVPSQLDPRYLELVFAWYEKVVGVLASRSAANGGPIVLQQVDNEPNLVFSYGVEGSLYDPHVLGNGGLWEQWLAAAYGERWRDRYDMATGGPPPVPRTGNAATAAEARLATDWLRFKKGHVYEFIRRLAERVRALGLDLPFTMNEPINRYWPWGSGDHAGFAAFMEKTGIPMFPNGHCYLHYGGEQNVNGAPVTIARIESVKMSTLQGPPSIYELGSWYTVASGALGSYNWDIMTKLLIGSGMNGYSVYVYNDGRAAPGHGNIGASYDWNTAIGHDGSRRAPFQVLRRINGFVADWQQEILGGEKLFDVTVGIPGELPMVAANVTLAPDSAPVPLALAETTVDVNRGLTDLCRVLTHLSVSFELMSLDHPNREPGAATRLLVVPSNGTLSARGAAFVEAHLAAGGEAVFYPLVPTVDSDSALPDGAAGLDRLAALCGQRIAGTLGRGGAVAGDIRHRIIDGRHEVEVGLDTPLVYFEPPAGAEVLARHRGRAVAYRAAAGQGHATVLGMIPAFYTEATQRLFADLLVQAPGLARTACAPDGSILVLARGRRGGPVLLTAATILGEDASATVRLHAAGRDVTLPLEGSLEMKAKEARFLWVDLVLPEARLLYTTSQLSRGRSRGEYLASGAQGTAGQMAFDRPVRATVGGRPQAPARHGDAWLLTYEHARGPLAVTLG